MSFIEKKENKLFLLLAAFFLTNAIIAEFMGVKIFSFEKTFHLPLFEFDLLGEHIKGLNFTAGVILWPFVFIFTDIINEYFGIKGVRYLSLITALLIGYGFIMLQIGIYAAPADWWTQSSGIKNLNFNEAYIAVFGQSSKIIIASIIAFIVGQVIDVSIFHWVKERTGEKYIWLRATGSTLISQLIDSFVVLFLAFYAFNINSPTKWTLPLIFAVCIVNYFYKIVMAILLTPLIYLVRILIENYLGKELATKLRESAIVA